MIHPGTDLNQSIVARDVARVSRDANTSGQER